MTKLRWVFLGIVTAAACGGDAGSGPVSQSTAQEGCQRDCQHEIDCGSTATLAECTASCVADTVGVIRTDAFTDIIDCRTALACDAPSDPCLAECQPTAAHDHWHDQCQTALAACVPAADLAALCSVTPAGTGDAGYLCLVTPAIMDELTACIPTGVACEQAMTCLQNVATAHHLDF